MAEFVQQNLEEMIPELEQMQRVGLFTSAETSVILKRRRAFEYKLKRQTKSKEDFLQYIEYEMNVLALVRKRRKSIGYTFKRLEIDVAIVQRIHKLYKMACYRFQADIKLWLSYIEFCKMRKEKTSVSKIFTRMLQVHNQKPALWILAAEWELECGDVVTNARSILQRGLRFNTDSQKLWQEYFRLELIATEKLRKQAKDLQAVGTIKNIELNDPTLEGQTALTVYTKSTEQFPDNVEFLLSYLPICQQFDFTKPLQDKIIANIREKYGDSEIVWDFIARQHWHPADGSDKSTVREECYVTYDKAVKQLCTEKMWSFYIKACLSDLEESRNSERSKECVSKTLEVFQLASVKQCLSSDMFLSWLTVLSDIGEVDEIDRVSQLAVTKYPFSIVLWKMRLRILIVKRSSTYIVTSVLTEALQNVKVKESLPLWEICLQYCMLNSSDDTKALFEKALNSHSSVSQPLSEAYAEWISRTEGPKACRKLRKRLGALTRLSLGFYKKCIEIEENCSSPKIRHLRNIFESAVDVYGSQNIDLWLNYIKTEITHPNGNPELAGAIYWRAMKNLNDELTEQFVSQYALIQAGHELAAM